MQGADLVQLFLFISPRADFAGLCKAAAVRFPDWPIVACTTAGEIGPEGYAEDQIIAIGLPRRHFAAQPLLIEKLDQMDDDTVRDVLIHARMGLEKSHPDFDSNFAFLVVDGLSLQEDALLATIFPALGGVPLFGGSAGDGAAFGRTQVALNGTITENAAVLTFVVTDCETQVFTLNHMLPTEDRMVVTEADPACRIVKKINAEPAAAEYARIVGKAPGQLDEFTFAAHPVVVRMGDAHHVRAIQRVNAAGELIFFSAIDEGMVLSVARPQDLTGHLDAQLSNLGATRPPSDILACDCVLRRLEVEQSQSMREVSDVLSRHRVLGFSTYGEQIGPIHVNHTMTGVAIYPPAAPR